MAESNDEEQVLKRTISDHDIVFCKKPKIDEKVEEEDDTKVEDEGKFLCFIRPVFTNIGEACTAKCGYCKTNYEAMKLTEEDRICIRKTYPFPKILHRCAKEECQKNSEVTTTFQEWHDSWITAQRVRLFHPLWTSGPKDEYPCYNCDEVCEFMAFSDEDVSKMRSNPCAIFELCTKDECQKSVANAITFEAWKKLVY